MTKSVSAKMGIKPDSRVFLLRAPAESVQAIDLPAVTLAARLSGAFDYIHFFAKNQADLNKEFPRLREHLRPGGMLWISWPKAKKLGTDLTIKEVIRIGYNHGLVESKGISIDDTWSALKFTHPKKDKVYVNTYGRLLQQHGKLITPPTE